MQTGQLGLNVARRSGFRFSYSKPPKKCWIICRVYYQKSGNSEIVGSKVKTKIFALVLATLLIAASLTVAFAATETKTGSITISNAAKGETYTIYKLFDATVDASDNSKVAYKGTIPSTMTDYFEYTSTGSGYIQAKPAAFKNVTYYTTADKDVVTSDPTAYWDAVAGSEMSDGLKAALTTWAEGQTSNAGSQEAQGGAVVFSSLPLGYYVVTTTQGESAISVDTTNLNPQIIDKNTTTYTADKTVDDTSYSIGETITYTGTFDTTNYIGDEQVKSYTISDTLPEFLTNVRITSVTIDQDANNKTKYPDVDLSSTYTTFGNEKKIVIPWVDNNDASLYKNGSKIIIEYKAELTKVVNVNEDNTNTISITPNKDKTGDNPFNEHKEKDQEITTYAAALLKTDGTNGLPGAKFAFNGLTVEQISDGVYRVVTYDATSTTLGTVMDVNSTDGTLYIIGLKGGVTLTGKETEAPLGYNKLTSDIEVPAQIMTHEIFHSEETRYYDAKGNLVSESSSSTSHKDVEKNLSDLNATAVTVVNEQGTELPSTGGMGTTLFYVGGGILVLAAVILLVTKKRMAGND